MQDLDIDLTFLQENNKHVIALKLEQYLNNGMGSYLNIFTDGAREPESGKAGFGVYITQLDLRISQRITNERSVFTTELLAMLWALWWIEDVKKHISETLICSDSAAALMALKGGKSKACPDIIN